MDINTQVTQDSAERETYSPPTLTVHGSMSDLTKGGGANNLSPPDGDATYAS